MIIWTKLCVGWKSRAWGVQHKGSHFTRRALFTAGELEVGRSNTKTRAGVANLA